MIYNRSNKFMKRITIIALSVAFLTACPSFGKDTSKANPYNQTLAAIPAAELPAQAADLVLQAKPRARQAVTVNVVKSAVGINPAAAPAIVGAIARAVPQMASVAAGAAASEQPKQASAIAKAAAAAAPAKAGQIVMAVCRAVPNEYQAIAVAVSQAVPGAGKEIVEAVAAALPNLEVAIDKAIASYGGNVASVADTLAQAARISTVADTSSTLTAAGGGSFARGPAVGPPYIPLTTTPTSVTPGTSGQVPAGGRNYAAP
jgi:hypothetical protein